MSETVTTTKASPYRQVCDKLREIGAKRMFESDLGNRREGRIEFWYYMGRAVIVQVHPDLGVQVYRPVNELNAIAEEIRQMVEYLKGEKSDGPVAVLREFVADIEAAYGDSWEVLDEQWPDLKAPYQKAKKIVGGSE